MNFTATRDEFAAAQSEIQLKDESYLIGSARHALRNWGKAGWYNALLRRVEQVARTAYRRESGHISSDDLRSRLNKMHDELVTALDKTKDPEGRIEQRAQALAKSLSSLANAVGMEAASHDDENDIGLEWVTMHDDRVRNTHREADGQVRRPHEKYDVGGFKMSRPGDTTVPIELWINCRCALRPVRMDAEAVVASTISDQNYKSGGDMPEDLLEDVDMENIDDIGEVDDVEFVPFHGVLAPEGVVSGDGRKFRAGAMRWRDLPLPMAWQKINADGHDGSVVIGHIDEIWRDEAGLLQYEGGFTVSPESDEVISLVADQSLRGVSADVDSATMAFENEDGEEVTFDSMFEADPEATFTSVLTDGRICGATICPIPAFMEAYIALGPHPNKPAPADPMADKELSDGYTTETEEFVKTEDGPGWLTHPVDTERLRRYWTKGPGAAKIRWGVPGDFNRCRAQLAKYVKPIYLSGYCANRHYDALGFWPGRPVSGDTVEFAISEKPWDGSASRFTIEEWRRSCLIDTDEGDSDSKSRYKLPIKEPNGDLSRAAVHNAASRINQVDAPSGKVSSARAALRRAYKTLGEDPPETLSAITESFHLVAAAGGERWIPRGEFFRDPQLSQPTRITITEDGHVFGHLAQWGVCHIGIDGVCTTPPYSATDYAFFAKGVRLTTEGEIRVGVLTMGCGHAGANVSASVAAAHYDNVNWGCAEVAIGEDEFGIWFSGAMKPHITQAQIDDIRAAGAVSGDWRYQEPVDNLELVAGLIVNVPGFPIYSTQLAASGGRQIALVASGVVTDSVDTRQVKEIVAAAIEEHMEMLERRRAMAELSLEVATSRMKALAATRK